MSAETLQHGSVYVRSKWERKPLMHLVLPSETQGSHLVGRGIALRTSNSPRIGFAAGLFPGQTAAKWQLFLLPQPRIATE